MDATQLTIDPKHFEQELENYKNKTLQLANSAYSANQGGEDLKKGEDNNNAYKELSISEMKILWRKNNIILNKKNSKNKKNPFAKLTSNAIKKEEEENDEHLSVKSSSALLLKTPNTIQKDYNPFSSDLFSSSVNASDVRSKYKFMNHENTDSLTLKEV